MRAPSVLVVDDDADNRGIICSVMQEVAGYRAQGVVDGEQALAIAKADPPDVILLDLILPGLDGFTVAQRLKTDPATRGVPILAISGLTRQGDRAEALAVGCDDYIDKPFGVDELIDRVNRLLAARSTSSG